MIIVFVLGSFILSSYTWEPWGPEGIKANRLFFTWEHSIICVDSGMYLVPEIYPQDWEYFSFPAWGTVQLNTDTLLIIHREGSGGDGVYAFNLQTHEFSPLVYCLNPNFIMFEDEFYVGHESGLLKSSDGLLWTPVIAFANKKCMDMASVWYSGLAVATETPNDNVLFSEDQGTSWAPITGEFMITNLASINHHSRLGGLCKSGDFQGFYVLDGVDWEFQFEETEIFTLGTDNFGDPFFGWHTPEGSNEGIARFHFTQPYGGTLEFFNEGLPDLNINHITYHPFLVGGKSVSCCTDSGAFISYNFALYLEKSFQDGVEIKAYPNPFAATIIIDYEIYTASNIHITIYNSMGEEMFLVDKGVMNPGRHTVTWSPAHNIPAGMYFGVLRSGEGVSVLKMVKL